MSKPPHTLMFFVVKSHVMCFAPFLYFDGVPFGIAFETMI